MRYHGYGGAGGDQIAQLLLASCGVAFARAESRRETKDAESPPSGAELAKRAIETGPRFGTQAPVEKIFS